jgi:hypothetical protein
MLFVLGSFATVFADDGGMDSVRSAVAGSKVTIGGDAYVEGYWLGNHDLDSDTDADDRFWNQRVRLKIHAAIGGVEVRTRLTTDDQQWNRAINTGGNIAVDYAYLHVPIGGPVVLDFGRQKSDWGNKLYEWNATRDRAKVTVDIVDKVSLGVYTDKWDETNATPGEDNLVDDDDYAFFAIANLDVVEVGILEVNMIDARGDGLASFAFDLFANAEFAGVQIGTEFAIVTGEHFEFIDVDTGELVDDPQIGFFASGGYTIQGLVSLEGLIGLTMNNYVADSHFTPTVMIGTDQTTAIMDFGGTGQADVFTAWLLSMDPVLFAGSDIDEINADTYLIAATATFQPIPVLSLYGRGAYMMSQDATITGVIPAFGFDGTTVTDELEMSAIEIDLGLEYQIADNTTFNVDFGYMIPDIEMDGDDLDADNAFSAGQSINISF